MQLVATPEKKVKQPELSRLARFNGYRPRQAGFAAIRFTWVLDISGPIDLQQVDAWLDILIDTNNKPEAPAKKDKLALWMALTTRGLALANALLQAGRVPVFAPGRVLEIRSTRHNPTTWQATIELPVLDHIPERIYGIALGAARRALQYIAMRPLTPENRAPLFAALDKEAVKLIQPMVPGGKSTLPVLLVAWKLGIPFSHLGGGIYQLGWGSQSRRMDRSTTEKDSAIGSKLSQNKLWTASLLREAGLPAPVHGVATTVEEGLRIANKIGWPVVVKPADLDRGEGVTVGVRNDAELHAAFNIAKGRGKGRQVIVEREVSGVCHRLFIAGGKLLYAVKRLPKSIHGDGRQTIAALIRAANENENRRPPWLCTEAYPDDQEAIDALANAGLNLASIPGMGERVSLRHIESTAAGGFDEDVTDSIHPENLEVALRATALFDLEVAGIDIITPDIGRPWHENGAIINEVNFAPLFGGGDISRNHIPEFFSRFLGGNGRISVEIYVGGAEALVAARQRQQELATQGVACYLTSHGTTLSPTGETLLLPFASLFRRSRALLMERRVAALVMVVQTDELLYTGLPVDRIQHITITDEMLLTHGKPDMPLNKDRLDNLFALLRSMTGAH